MGYDRFKQEKLTHVSDCVQNVSTRFSIFVSRMRWTGRQGWISDDPEI
jgi:hypothetical protein